MVSPAKLREILQVLTDYHVTEYATEQFRVKLGQVEVQTEVTEASFPKEPTKSLWHDKSLWPDGKPPEFQAYKKDKK